MIQKNSDGIVIIPTPLPVRVPPPPPPPRVVKATELSRHESSKAADHLISAFGWSDTAEGSDFWQGVYERLIQISRDGVLKVVR